jgi:hypothetical protein
VSVPLTLPCRVITLNVKLGPRKGGTTLEAMAAEAIQLGYDTATRLAGFFALPEPVIVDVVHSLWNGGWVWLDFETGSIGLTERAEKQTWDPAGDPAVRTERREYLYEPLSQLVFSQGSGRRRPHREHLEVPADVEATLTIADTSQVELRGAVQRLVEDEQRTSAQTVVLSVLPAGAGEGQDAGLRWVELDVSVARNETTGRVHLQAVDPRAWPAPAVARLSKRLANYVARWPRSKFSTQLQGRVTAMLERSPSIETLLGRMGEVLDRPVKPDSVASWRDRQAVLENNARAVHQYLDQLSRMQARTDLLLSREARMAALRMTIRQARQQLVIVTPEVGVPALRLLMECGLERALEANVQLILLWGARGNLKLSGPLGAQVSAWRNRFPGQIQVPQDSVATSTGIVIADDRDAVLGSGDLFGGEVSEHAAVWIRSAGEAADAPAATAVLTLLTWARSRCPDWLLGQSILTAAEFAGPPAEDTLDAREPELPAIPENADMDTLPMWHAGWAEYRDMLAAVVRAVPERRPAVEVLLDGEIDDAVCDRVQHAGRRLAVADDTTADLSLRARLLVEMEERWQDGVIVQLTCPPPPEVRAGTALDRLPAGPVPRRPRGRVLLADNQVIIGAAAPLTEPRNESEARRSRVSVCIHHRERADEVADWLEVPAPAQTQAPETDADERGGARGALALAQGAQYAKRDGQPLDEYLHHILDADAEPWTILDNLREHQADEHLLRSVVATVLQREGTSEAIRARWAGWLIEHLWEQSEFVAAAAVSGLLPDLPECMPQEVCVLAAAVEHAPLRMDLAGLALSLAVRGDADPKARAVRTAGTVGLLAAYLLGGEVAAREGLKLLTEDDLLPPRWKDLVLRATERYGESHAPLLPIADLAARLSQDAGRDDAQVRWEEIGRETNRLIKLSNRFTFKSGAVMFQRITAEDGILSRLAAAATSRDAARQRDVVADLPVKVLPYLNKIVDDARGEPIAWRKHRSFLDRIDEVFRLARAAAVEEASGTTGAAAAVRTADLEIARLILDGWSDLHSEATYLTRPYGAPLLALLDRFRPLIAWKEARP